MKQLDGKEEVSETTRNRWKYEAHWLHPWNPDVSDDEEDEVQRLFEKSLGKE